MILGVIPARGGSKGVPGKNIKPISGKPLIQWSIEQAEASSLLDRFIVSTEDDEIAQVALDAGAEVLKRPPKLATDTASTLSVLQHVVEEIDCETLVLLQATSPVRKKKLIDECINEFLSQKADSLATGFNCKYVGYGKNSKRRQEIDGFFYDDGNVYVIKSDMIRKGDRFGKKIIKKEISREENCEIDDEFDFWLVEKILLERSA